MASQAAAAPASSGAVKFKAKVTQADQPAYQGLHDAVLTPQALELWKKKELLLSVPVGSPAELVAAQQVRLKTSAGALTLQVQKQLGYPEKLAQHLVGLFRRERPALVPSEYELPKWLLVLACLPLVLVLGGGAVGGLIGGLVAAINLAVARRESLPAAVRAVIMVALGGCAVVAFAVVVLLLQGLLNGPAQPQVQPQLPPPLPSPIAVAPVIEPAAPGPVATGIDPRVLELGQKGVVTIQAHPSDVRAIALGPQTHTVTVGHADGAITFCSLAASIDPAKVMARVSGKIDRLQRLSGNHLLVTTGETHYLVSNRGKVLRVPWRWASVYGTDLIAGIDNGTFFRRGVMSGEIDRLGDDVTELPDSLLVRSLFGVELKDRPLPVAQPVTFLGGTGPFVGFADGTTAVESLDTWVQARYSDAPVTASRGIFTGYADGKVAQADQVQSCGSAAIVGFAEVHPQNFAIDANGGVWELDSTKPPRLLSTKLPIGPVRSILAIDGAIVVAAEKGLNFYTPTEFAKVTGSE